MMCALAKRNDILTKIDVLQDERREIMRAAYNRWDIEMAGKLPSERLKAQFHNDSLNDTERIRIKEIDQSIAGYRHLLDQGFFQEKPTPKEDSEEDPLY